MFDRLRFLLSRMGERLWIRPLVVSIVSLAGVILAKAADETAAGSFLPAVTSESIESLLSVMASSMLVIATFAVGSMVTAYASASSTATPRTFSLVVSDDMSQNALSIFIAAFIFSLVSLIALLNGFYGSAGRFALLAMTVTTLIVVVLTFVGWVNRIARLGRLGSTTDKVEAVTAKALCRRRESPTLHGAPATHDTDTGQAIHSSVVGYVQRVDMDVLHTCAEVNDVRISVESLPGTFAAPDTVLARVTAESGDMSTIDVDTVVSAFVIGDARTFEDDPRFGLVVLSEIASRALSPAVNDPGTAIDVIGTLVRLFALWSEPLEERASLVPHYDRVAVPRLSTDDMFDDAFTGIARDGAGTVEVMGRLQKAFSSLAAMSDGVMADAARRHARLALARAEHALSLPEDKDLVRRLAVFANPDTN